MSSTADVSLLSACCAGIDAGLWECFEGGVTGLATGYPVGSAQGSGGVVEARRAALDQRVRLVGVCAAPTVQS